MNSQKGITRVTPVKAGVYNCLKILDDLSSTELQNRKKTTFCESGNYTLVKIV